MVATQRSVDDRRTRMGRSGLANRAALSTLVAQALLHLCDIPWLADSPLVELPQVRARWHDSRQLFAEGRALQVYLRETVDGVIDRLEGDGKIGVLRSLLRGVCDGQSIAQIAREHGKTREHVSRHYWKQAAALVTREVAAGNGATRTTNRGASLR